MQITLDIVTVFIGILGTLVSTTVALLVYFSSRQNQRAEIHHEIEHTYDNLMKFRATHPEVLALSRKWDDGYFKFLYSFPKEEASSWVIYYTYVELCLAFINAVLFGRDIKVLDRRAYQYHYRPLILLLLSEHYPYIKSVIGSSYISIYIKKFVQEVSSSGWDWNVRHRALAGEIKT